MVGNGRSDSNQNSHGDYLEEDDDDDDYSEDDLVDTKQSFSRSSSYTFRQHNKARDLDVEVYNSILVTLSREQGGDHAASVMERIVDDNMKFNFYTAKDRGIVSTRDAGRYRIHLGENDS